MHTESEYTYCFIFIFIFSLNTSGYSSEIHERTLLKAISLKLKPQFSFSFKRAKLRFSCSTYSKSYQVTNTWKDTRNFIGRRSKKTLTIVFLLFLFLLFLLSGVLNVPHSLEQCAFHKRKFKTFVPHLKDAHGSRIKTTAVDNST